MHRFREFKSNEYLFPHPLPADDAGLSELAARILHVLRRHSNRLAAAVYVRWSRPCETPAERREATAYGTSGQIVDTQSLPFVRLGSASETLEYAAQRAAEWHPGWKLEIG
jgi:hypothetical protein